MTWRVAAAGALFSVTVIVAGGGANAVATQESTPSRRFTAQAATAVLATIPIERERPSGYRRDLFPHWLDVDGDGCDAREQVLRRDAIGFAQVDGFRCFVVEADWRSPYVGVATSDRTSVDIDHVVALKEAWDSGAWAWSEARRTAFANDTSDVRTLRAVSSRSNRTKGDRDPSNWMPQLASYWCTYVGDWISIKARWSLSMDESEWRRVNNVLSTRCAGLTIAPWTAPPGGSAPAAPATPLTTPLTSPSNSPAGTVATTPATTPATSRTTGSSPTSVTATAVAPVGEASAVADIRPGAYCAPLGALGTYRSVQYVCSTTNADGVPYSGGRARWRRA